MNPKHILPLAQKFLTDNAPAILTGVGVLGTVGTGVLAGRGGWVAAHILERKQREHLSVALPADADELPADFKSLATRDKLLATVPPFLPAVAVGGGTITAIIFANKINASRLAALAAVYALSDGKLKDYKAKVEELMGVEKKHEVEDAVAHDRVDKLEKQSGQKILVIGDGTGLFYDSFSARPFTSTMNQLEAARNKINLIVLKDGFATLNDWYREIGLDETGYGDDKGWSTHFPFEFEPRPSMGSDDRPMAYIDYDVESVARFRAQ